MRDPRIIAQSSDPRFAQQNPRMVQIRTLHLTYISHGTRFPSHTKDLYTYHIFSNLTRTIYIHGMYKVVYVYIPCHRNYFLIMG